MKREAGLERLAKATFGILELEALALAMNPVVLLLDDDASFRTLLSRILLIGGYAVVEAGTVAEALSVLETHQVALAVVDFRLPDDNGMSFVSRMRDMGNYAPVVFLSSAHLDRQSFAHLRNILRVSLILQKPLDPQLFLHQIETLLPAPDHAPLDVINTSIETAFTTQSHSKAQAEPHQADRASAGYVPGHTADPQSESHAEQLRTQAELENTIRRAQRDLAADLPELWRNLARQLREVQHDLHNARRRYELYTFVHELRMSAQGLGLEKVAQAAGKIEGYTKLIDPSDLSGNDVLWLEIFRALADGEGALRSVTDSSEHAAHQDPVQAGNVLLVGGANTLQPPAVYVKPTVEAKITFSNNPQEAALKATQLQLDAAVLDVAAFGKQACFALAGEVRSMKQNAALPTAFILPDGGALSEMERLYYGCSVSLTAPVSQQQLEACLVRLSTLNQSSDARVLVVDDDRVLTTLIERVLGSYGMTVYALNEPIRIIETLERVQPDLILLDVIMPGLSGYDLCRTLRATDKWSKMPIIFLTSKSDAAGRQAAFQAGGNDFLAKPILSDELLVRVRMQLQRARDEQERDNADSATGLLSERAFLARANQVFIDAGRSSEELSLCFVEIEDFDRLQEHGTFAKMNALATLGKLLRARFPAEVLRGRHGHAGFALIFRKEQSSVVNAALDMLKREFGALKMSSPGGGNKPFSAQAATAIASYPQHGTSLKALLEHAATHLHAPEPRSAIRPNNSSTSPNNSSSGSFRFY